MICIITNVSALLNLLAMHCGTKLWEESERNHDVVIFIVKWFLKSFPFWSLGAIIRVRHIYLKLKVQHFYSNITVNIIGF